MYKYSRKYKHYYSCPVCGLRWELERDVICNSICPNCGEHTIAPYSSKDLRPDLKVC